MTIHQKHIANSQWKMLKGNAQLEISFQHNIRVERKLFENAGMGLQAFMTNFANHVPARLVFEDDRKGGLITNLWVKVDPAQVAQNTGGIDLTPAKMNVVG